MDSPRLPAQDGTTVRPPIRLELFGSPHVVIGDARFLLIPRDAALLAYLAIEGPTPRERFFELLWPGRDKAPAQSHLRQNLLRLEVRCGRSLAFGNPVLKLEPSVQALRLGAAVDDDVPWQPLLCKVDTAAWPAFDEWLAHYRKRAAASRRGRLVRRIEEWVERGIPEEALPLARRLVEEDADDEEAHRRLIELNVRRGDRPAALAAFDACRRALARAGGDPPGPRTLEWVAAIERGDSAPRPTLAVSPSLVRPPRLVGRSDACNAVEVAWQSGLPVLIVGEAGVGKSRLLSDLVSSQGTGMLPVSAREGDAGIAYSLLARLLETLAQSFGIPVGWPRPTLAGLVAAWGEAPAQRLLPCAYARRSTSRSTAGDRKDCTCWWSTTCTTQTKVRSTG